VSAPPPEAPEAGWLRAAAVALAVFGFWTLAALGWAQPAPEYWALTCGWTLAPAAVALSPFVWGCHRWAWRAALGLAVWVPGWPALALLVRGGRTGIEDYLFAMLLGALGAALVPSVVIAVLLWLGRPAVR
jgi:hypothetical protein